MGKMLPPALLFVDDEKRVLKSLKLWFTNEGFRVFTAAGGKEAEDLLVGNRVDVAVVDYKIGKEDGITISQKLRDVDENLKIIILTGFPTYETAVEAMKIGVFDYLSKAATNDKLLHVVKKAVAERRHDLSVKKAAPPSDKRVKMVLFCTHSLIIERLENFSRTSPEFKLAKSFSSVETFGVKPVGPDVQIALICAGCNLKRLKDAYTIFPELYRSFPGVRILLINESFSDEEKVELLKLGVRGFVSQDSSSDTLEKALNHIGKGELWVSRGVTQLSLKSMVSYDSRGTKRIRETFGLTHREIEILRRMTQGMKNKEIATTLLISETTVKTHINRIFKKMGVDNRSRAILAALEKKII